MGKFNSFIEPNRVSRASETTNFEGGKAYSASPEVELYTRVASYLVKEPKFYGDVDSELERIFDLIKVVHSVNPQFLLKLAVYARNELHLRSVPILLLGAAAQLKTPKLRGYVPSIIKRADELAEIISYIITTNEDNLGTLSTHKPAMLPNPLRRGLADVFHKFDEYQFSKYDRNNSNVTMQDVIRLVHPIPITAEQGKLYSKIAKDELEPADTWEHFISTNGSNKENWEQAAKKMPIMATLRNLRNLLSHNASHETFDYVIQKLTDEKIIVNSKQFPFRFYSAYKSIEDDPNPQAGRLLTALNKSIDLSVKSLSLLGFNGTSAVFADNSGSMTNEISKKSDIMLMDIANIFAAIVSKLSPNNIVGSFADDFRTVNFAEQDSVLTRKEKIQRLQVGSSTNAFLAIRYLNNKNIKVDRIFIFSDQQCYDSVEYSNQSIAEEWQKYKRKYPNTYLYSFDLDGYGTLQVPENDPRALTIAGWSENILKYIPKFEQNKDSVIKQIDSIQPEVFY